MRYLLTLSLIVALLFSTQALSAQQRIKVMQYNLLMFGSQEACAPPLADKDVWLRSILSHYRPDIFTVNELIPNIAYVNRIKQLAFNFTNSIEYGDLTNDAGSNIGNMIFYNKDLLGYDAGKSTVIANPLRDINVYVLYDLASAAAGDTIYLYCIVTHFKASQGTANATTRNVAAQAISDWIEVNAPAENVLVMGDMNIYTPSEAAYQTLVLNADTTRRLIDPAGLSGGWGGSTNAVHMTQSTRSSGTGCGAGGGMDDRFDMILASKTLWRGEAGITYAPGTYAAFGNDGLGFNGSLNCNSNNTVPNAVCNSLISMSDHLPVIMELDFDAPTSLTSPHLLSGIDLRILGNPAHSQVELALQVDTHPGTLLRLEMRDTWGRMLFRQVIDPQNQRIQIPVESFSTGIYFLKLSDEKGRFLNQRIQVIH